MVKAIREAEKMIGQVDYELTKNKQKEEIFHDHPIPRQYLKGRNFQSNEC